MQAVMGGLGTDKNGHLTLGGVSVPALAREYGTPLYLLDEDVVRENCRALYGGLKDYPAPHIIAFASKALCFKALYGVLAEEGMGADVVSGGELLTALRGGLDPSVIYFHGNNKTEAELRFALENKVRRIVVDNAEELDRLARIAEETGAEPEIALRVKPGVEAHTHEFVMTGSVDSKFGVALEDGEALAIAKRAAALPRIRLVGIHCHIGSQILDAEPFRVAAGVMLKFMAQARELDIPIRELNLGGGFGIKYLPSHDPVPLREMTAFCGDSVARAAAELGLPVPELVLEPGRSVTGSAGLTVYTVGSVKHICTLKKTYVAVDGGMADNPRYALYGAQYQAILPERPHEPPAQTVAVAGRCCESGDMVTAGAEIPEVRAGELLAIQATGAFNYSMASHYNRLPNPPVVMVRNGSHRLVVRRETDEDLLRNDV